MRRLRNGAIGVGFVGLAVGMGYLGGTGHGWAAFGCAAVLAFAIAAMLPI